MHAKRNRTSPKYAAGLASLRSCVERGFIYFDFDNTFLYIFAFLFFILLLFTHTNLHTEEDAIKPHSPTQDIHQARAQLAIASYS